MKQELLLIMTKMTNMKKNTRAIKMKQLHQIQVKTPTECYFSHHNITRKYNNKSRMVFLSEKAFYIILHYFIFFIHGLYEEIFIPIFEK